jgi:DNA-binding MarR family transcriptional regulator
MPLSLVVMPRPWQRSLPLSIVCPTKYTSSDMGTSAKGSAPAAAAEAWATMRSLAMAQRGRVLAVASEAGLSPPQVFALLALTPGERAPMGDLAGILRCDASNVTGLTDRLEARGLVERRAAPHDRRVRHLVLTDAGAALREQVAERLEAPPDGFAQLTAGEAETLRDLLLKVAAADAPPPA